MGESNVIKFIDPRRHSEELRRRTLDIMGRPKGMPPRLDIQIGLQQMSRDRVPYPFKAVSREVRDALCALGIIEENLEGSGYIMPKAMADMVRGWTLPIPEDGIGIQKLESSDNGRPCDVAYNY